MIKINLLPSELRGKKIKDKSSGGPVFGALVTTLSILGILVVSGATAWFLWNKVNSVTKESERLTKQATLLQKQYDQKFAKNVEMKKKWDRMKIQEEILNSLVPENPLLWSEKMNMISNAIPSGGDVFSTDYVANKKYLKKFPDLPVWAQTG